MVNIDFVLFCECWMVVENIFCLLWYYKNIMFELMGNIYGEYDVKLQGFVFGGMSLYNMMLLYGFDKEVFEKVLNVNFGLDKLDWIMLFMFEICFFQYLIEFVVKEVLLQDDYIDCWDSIEKKFDGILGIK